MSIADTCRSVKSAAIKLAACSTEVKNGALARIAKELAAHKEEIFRANQEDLRRSEAENLPVPLLKRLRFDESKLTDVIAGINSLIELEDPVGRTLLATELDEGLELYRVTCPIGAIGVIFESRPDALVQISTLCLKSGNGVLLKGGSEAIETNRVLARIIISASEAAGSPKDGAACWARYEINELLKQDKYIDRDPGGSNEFVRYIMDNFNPSWAYRRHMPCLSIPADPGWHRIAIDSKTQYVAVCNAMETLLVHRISPKLSSAAEKSGS